MRDYMPEGGYVKGGLALGGWECQQRRSGRYSSARTESRGRLERAARPV
jgi:hypothetical protein